MHANVNHMQQDHIEALGLPLGLTEALRRLAMHQASPVRHRRPVGVIGPGDAEGQVYDDARLIARALAAAGMAIVCGGRGGVMAAASQGATEAGGVAIGILPEEDERNANPYLSVALPTGIGEMRNALIARSALCLVAVGYNMGTLSEMALGLKWERPVFVLHGEPSLPGAVEVADVQQMLGCVVDCLLGDAASA